MKLKMDPKKLNWLENINLAKYLNLVAHKVTLNKDLWDRKYYSNLMENALRSFECKECGQWATVIDFKTKKSYCDDHRSLMDSCDDNLNLIENIWQMFNQKLMKVEKMLILIQERELFFTTNQKKKRIIEKEKESI